MPRATLTLTTPPETWIHDVSTAHPSVVFRVLTVLGGAEGGIVLVELEADDLLPVIDELARSADVTALDLLWKRRDRALLQVEMTAPRLLLSLVRAGVSPETPFEIRGGTVDWEVTTSSARLADLGRRLKAAGVPFDLASLRDVDAGKPTVLTTRQRELLLLAVEQGYYESPRLVTLTALASDASIAKSTASDILHRAERNIVDWFVDQHLDGGA